MKKVLSIVLTVCLIAGVFSVCAFSEEKTPTESFLAIFDTFDTDGDGVISINEAQKAADIDGDGETTLSDARTLLKIAADIEPEPEDVCCDLNCDGVVSAEDARKAMRITLGIDSTVINDDVVVNYLCNELNRVKTEKPGFDRTVTQKCQTMKVTATGAPISGMNANNVEYYQYLEQSKKVLEDYRLLIIMSSGREEYEETIEAMDEAIAQAKLIYEPQTTTKTVSRGSSSHNSYFPVFYYSWACKLTSEDIKDISCKFDGNNIILTVNMNNYNYTAKNYPYTSSGADQQKKLELPYGKAFNLPDTNTGGGAKFEALNLKNGKIVCTIDKTTGDITNVDYSYSYVLKYSQTDDTAGSGISMVLTQTADYAENYVMMTVD